MKTPPGFLPVLIGMILHCAAPVPGAASPSRRASRRAAIPTAQQAIIKAIETSGGYSLFDWQTGVSAERRPDGSVQVRFVQYVTNYKTHAYDEMSPHTLLVVAFTGSGVKRQLVDKGALHRGTRSRMANNQICKAVARTYAYYLRHCGKHTKFDVQAEAVTPEALSFPWGNEGATPYRYKYLVSIMPHEPGSRFHFRLSRSYKVLGVLPGT